VILVVWTAVPDLPFSTARSPVDVHVPGAGVALAKCIVKLSEIRSLAASRRERHRNS
jgi:hypothetical protein